jgi:hypothetical protein
VPGEDPTRVGGRRIVAAIIDLGILVVLYVLLFAVLSRRAPVATWVGRGSNICAGRGISCATFGHRYIDGPRRFLLQLLSLAYLVGVFVLQRGLTGSTLGTRLLGIVTVGEDGKPIGPLRALGRSVAGIVDYIPCCLPIVGIVTIFATTGHRRVGDMAARSLVVPRGYEGSPIVVPGLGTGVVAPAPGYAVTTVPPVPPVPPVSSTPPAPVAPGPTATWPAAADTPGWAAATPPASPPESPAAPGAQPYSPPVPPAASAPAPGTPSATPPAPADPTQPQWDAERGAYIQWDQVGQRWMQFDQASQQWGPI